MTYGVESLRSHTVSILMSPLVNLADSQVPLPDTLVVDASLLLVLRRGSCHPHRVAARTFLRRVGNECLNGNMLCLAPTLVLEECYFKIIQAHIERNKPARQTWHQYYKNNPQVIQQCVIHITTFHRFVMAIPVTIVTPEDLALRQPSNTLEDRMRHFISTSNLLPKDAYILAVAERLGVDSVATLDRDWQRAAQFTVYTC
jgi:predicted nucleic acid-binding protein